MEISKMKNMIILKNPPSNLVEEAIIILKSNRKVQELKYTEIKKNNQSNNLKEKDYIIKEAESVISNYISKVENKEKQKSNLKIEKKYKMLKKYSIILTIILIMSFIKIII